MNEYKYLVGSKLLKLTNNRDEDWIVFTTEKSSVAQKTSSHSISFYQTLINHFTGNRKTKADPFKALYLYQLSNGFITDENYPFKDFNVLEHKAAWKSWLKAYVDSKATEAWAVRTEMLPKQFYQLLYQYYMIKENTHWISEEAKAEVQKIHDLEMPSSYFEELRALINSL